MKNIVLTINGKKISSPPGTSILEAAGKNAIKIPTLCSHADLAPHGACRFCLVEEENTGRLMASCVTPVAQDMIIQTDSPRVTGHRKNIARLMIAEHPESCIVCNKGNRCELRMVAAQLGVAETGLYPMPNYKPFETNNPFIIRDLSKCILCGKCIRGDHELVAVGAIDYNDRGFPSRPATLYGQPLEASNCTFCGTCVSLCPTGALSTHNTFFVGTPQREATSICGFCSAGCSLTMGVASQHTTGETFIDRVVEVSPSSDIGTVNGPTLCVRGHFAHDFLLSPDRLTHPLIKRPSEEGVASLQPCSIDEAIATIASRLADIKRLHGPDSIGFIGSTKCTNEENYLFQKIARVIFNTNNITTSGILNGQALLRELDRKTLDASRVNPLSGLENAQAIVTILADPDHSVPVAGYHIKRGVKKGAPLVAIDPYRTDIAAFGTIWLHPEKSTESQPLPHDIINALAARLIHENGADQAFMDQKTNDPHGWFENIVSVNPDTYAVQAGVSPEKIKKAAEMLKGKKIAVVLPGDLLERKNGKEIFDAAFNLALLTGSIGDTHAGIFILSLENNLAGAMDMGCVPDMLPGRRPIEKPEERKILEDSWQTSLPTNPGMDIHAMIEAAEAGTLKALYIMGENLLRTLPDPDRVRSALEKLDFIVVQEIIRNKTAEIADVILPAAAFAEKQGSFTNMEGRLQSFDAVVPPPGDALADWKLLAMLAEKNGHTEDYTTVENIQREIRQIIPGYSEIGSHRQVWVSQPETKQSETFAFAPLSAARATTTDKDYPFSAFIGNLRWHLGSGTRTSRSGRIKASGKAGEIAISTKDAHALGLNKGSKDDGGAVIRLVSPFGAVSRAYVVDPAVPPGQVFIPQGFSGNDLMQITDFSALKDTGSGWRNVNVRIEKIISSTD